MLVTSIFKKLNLLHGSGKVVSRKYLTEKYNVSKCQVCKREKVYGILLLEMSGMQKGKGVRNTSSENARYAICAKEKRCTEYYFSKHHSIKISTKY